MYGEVAKNAALSENTGFAGRCGLYQKDLAQLLKCSQQTYSDYECGKVDIPTEVLLRLADYYDTTVDYILGRTTKR